MFTPRPRQGTHPRTVARKTRGRPRRLAAVLAAIACGLLASTSAVPVAFAGIIPVPDGGYGPATPVPSATVRVVAVGGMAGWQIILIAVGAALVGAAATLLLVRARTVHRATLATSD
jgi:hypothetical protein